jgi:flagellar motor switch/type III secretory pathway protein FliN
MAHILAPEAAVARDLRWWSNMALAAMSAQLEPALRAWEGAWGISPSITSLCNAGDGEFDSRTISWQALQTSGSQVLVGVIDGTPAALIEQALWGQANAQAQGLARALAANAWSDLCERLASSLPEQAVRTSDDALQAERAWSGDVVWRIQFAAGGVALFHFDAALVAAMPAVASVVHVRREHAQQATRAPLTAMADALSAQAVKIRVDLHPVSCDIGLLQRLKTGDVLTLGHRLDEPVVLGTVQPGSGARATAPLCRAHLGQRAGRKAIALARNETPSH